MAKTHHDHTCAKYTNTLNLYHIGPADKVERIPVTEESHPFGANDYTRAPVDLKKYDYVEEEYSIFGRANVYTWPMGERYVKIWQDNAPYGSRFIIRKPAKSENFSGTVYVELYNWACRFDSPIATWANAHEYILREGDAWVGVTIHSSCLENLKRFDNSRYGELGFPNPLPEDQRDERPVTHGYPDVIDTDFENGLAWDLYSQTAMLLREDNARNPLNGYDVKAIIGTGASGGDLATYVAAIDPCVCTMGEQNIYDGYMIYMTGCPGMVNQYEQKLHALDERAKFTCKVPLIRTYTAADITDKYYHPDWSLMQRRYDSDAPGFYYRGYEISGPGVAMISTYRTESTFEEIEKMGEKILDEMRVDIDEYEFPVKYAYHAILDHLKKWIIDGIAPPSFPPLDFTGRYPDCDVALDEVGNPAGGIRIPQILVPTHVYDFRFEPKATKLPAEVLKKLYPTHDDYVKKMAEAVEKCVKEQTILQDDAEEIMRWADNAAIPE